MTLSNRDPDVTEESQVQAIRFAIDQALKNSVRTAIPGIVVEYDPMTARARVQPAIDLLLTNGETMPRPIILNVPVMFQTGGGYVSHLPLEPDDTVMLVFSERDMAVFKATLMSGPPVAPDIMPESGAVAWPGFMPLEYRLYDSQDPPTPFMPVQDGLVIQTVENNAYIRIKKAEYDDTGAKIVESEITIVADNLTVNANSITFNHSGGTSSWP